MKLKQTSNTIDFNSWSDVDLQAAFQDFDFHPDRPPMRHQLLTLGKVVSNDLNRTALFHDVGTGKTLTALWIAQHWKSKKILVVCPRSAFRAWKRDISKYTPFNYKIIDGPVEERKALLREARPNEIRVINYEGLKSVYARRLPIIETIQEAKIKYQWKINCSAITAFDTVIFDEIHKCKDYKTLQTQICYQLSHKSNHCIGLTGTPIGNCLFDLYNEYRVIDLGRSLGNNPFWFQREFFYKAGFDWEPKKGSEEKILSRVTPISTSFTRDECLDLPPKSHIVREAHFGKDQGKAYYEMLEKMSAKVDSGEVQSANALVLTSKLRQITGGFLYSGDAGGKITHTFKKNPKLDVLDDIVQETTRKIIVVHQFEAEGRLLETWATSRKIKFASYRGEIKDKEHQEDLFINDPSVQLLITMPIESLDFTCSNIMVFYSRGYSLLKHTQTKGRIDRQGQTQKMFYIDIVIKNSIDEAMIAEVQSKEQLANLVVDYIRQKS